jgi:hypothetical protein
MQGVMPRPESRSECITTMDLVGNQRFGTWLHWI